MCLHLQRPGRVGALRAARSEAAVSGRRVASNHRMHEQALMTGAAPTPTAAPDAKCAAAASAHPLTFCLPAVPAGTAALGARNNCLAGCIKASSGRERRTRGVSCTAQAAKHTQFEVANAPGLRPRPRRRTGHAKCGGLEQAAWHTGPMQILPMHAQQVALACRGHTKAKTECSACSCCAPQQ